MKRNKKVPKKVDEITFRKKGAGLMRLKDGRVVKKGDVFHANPEDIPNAFRDTLEVVTEGFSKEDQKDFKQHGTVKKKQPKFKKKLVVSDASDSEELYDIVSLDGKPVNEEPLTEEEANKLLTELN